MRGFSNVAMTHVPLNGDDDDFLTATAIKPALPPFAAQPGGMPGGLKRAHLAVINGAPGFFPGPGVAGATIQPQQLSNVPDDPGQRTPHTGRPSAADGSRRIELREDPGRVMRPQPDVQVPVHWHGGRVARHQPIEMLTE